MRKHFGGASCPVCERPVALNEVGIILLGGLNPIVAAEAGFEAENDSVSTLVDYQQLVDFRQVLSASRSLRQQSVTEEPTC